MIALQHINVQMTQQPSEPADQGDREQQDEDHKGSGHQA